MKTHNIKQGKSPGRIDYDSIETSVKLDRKDKKILTLLSKNARTPLTQVAKKVQLSRDAVDYRIKRLEEKGVILKFFANLNYDKLGYYMFHVFFLLDELDKGEQKKLFEHLEKHPSIVSVIEYSDRWDLEVLFIAKDLLQFDKIIVDIVTKFPHLILEKDKLEIIKRFNSMYVPPLLKKVKLEEDRNLSIKQKAASVDITDIKILRLLSEDCRMSSYEIAQKVGVSSDTVLYRINNLVKEGVIREFTTLVNLSKLKYIWYTYSVQMRMFDRKNEKMFEEFLIQNKNIIRSAKTLGGWDLLLYMVVSDTREFHGIVKEMKRVFSRVIRNYQTWVAFKEHVFKTMPEVIDKDVS